MAETKRGRTHDAAGAREAILNGAETIFAEQGFAGARIDAIAKTSGYNSSLIFHYFGDKLGLYVEVVRRADKEMSLLMARVLTPLLEDESITEEAGKFRTFLKSLITLFFDYVVEHPRFMRTLLWEQAEGWQTYTKIIANFTPEQGDPFNAIFGKAYKAGLLRSDLIPIIQVTLILQICLAYLTFIPLYQAALDPAEDLRSPSALTRAREQIVTFVVHGMMNDLPQINLPQTNS